MAVRDTVAKALEATTQLTSLQIEVSTLTQLTNIQIVSSPSMIFWRLFIDTVLMLALGCLPNITSMNFAWAPLDWHRLLQSKRFCGQWRHGQPVRECTCCLVLRLLKDLCWQGRQRCGYNDKGNRTWNALLIACGLAHILCFVSTSIGQSLCPFSWSSSS